MLRSRLLAVLGGLCVVLVGIALVRGRGLVGGGQAGAIASSALADFGFPPAGEAEVTLEVDQPLAWALERSRPGPTGVTLGRGDGGALRWRVRFAGGGEAVITEAGGVWSLRRPLPTNPGPDLFPAFVRPTFEDLVGRLVADPATWRWHGSQSWREEGALWHRARFLSSAARFPRGWRPELELELAGSTPVAVRHHVHPLGTDVGVVTGRIAELRLLRDVALLALGLLVVGVLLSAGEALAFRERLAPGRGVAVGLGVMALSLMSGAEALPAAGQAFAAALTVAMLPTWTSLPRGRPRLGVPAGTVLALALVALPGVVNGVGGWMPAAGAVPERVEVQRLLGEAWLPAAVQEPLLRGALPGLVGPVVGWWGGALAGAGVGALLGPLPSVPLVAGLGVEFARQLGLALVARWAGVGGALIAHGTSQALLRRPSYPAGLPWDLATLAPVVLGAVWFAVGRRRP